MAQESNKGWHCKKGVKLKFVCCCSAKIACPVWPWEALLLVWASGFFQFGQFISYPRSKDGLQQMENVLLYIVIIAAWLQRQNGPILLHYYILLLRHVVCEMMGCDYQIWQWFSSVCGLAKAASKGFAAGQRSICKVILLLSQAGQSPSSGWNWAVMVIRVGGAWEEKSYMHISAEIWELADNLDIIWHFHQHFA